MDNNNGMIGLALGSWLVAFAAGTLAGTLLWVLGGWGFFQGVFVGFVIFVVLGAMISWIMTRPLPAPGEVKIGKTTDAGQAASTPEAAPKPAPAPKAAPKAAAETEPAPAKSAPEASATSEARPAIMLDAPEGGQADDLKKITGVGPKLEQTLNELGIFHYEQVAKLKKADIAWVDERLRFKGRIERDDWVGQAKALAKAKG